MFFGDGNFYQFFVRRRARFDCEMVPCVWVYVPLENLEGIPLATLLCFTAVGRAEGICEGVGRIMFQSFPII